MQMPFFLVGFLVIIVMVLVGIAGLVLLIVGLATKRKALWGSGLAVMLLSFIAGGLTIGLGVRSLSQEINEAMVSSIAAVTLVSVSDEDMRFWFRNNAVVELPDDVALLNGRYYIVPSTPTYYLKISTPEGFEAFLKKHFSSEVSWGKVEKHFDLSWLDEDEKASMTFWDLSEIKRCSFFSKGHPELPDMTYIAYDKKKGIAYVVGEQGWN